MSEKTGYEQFKSDAGGCIKAIIIANVAIVALLVMLSILARCSGY